MHIMDITKMFAHPFLAGSLSSADILRGTFKAALALKKLNEKKNGDYDDYITNFDAKELKAAWADLRQTKLVRRAKLSKSKARIVRDMLVGLVVEDGLKLSQVVDSALDVLEDNGSARHGRHFLKANDQIVRFHQAIITVKKDDQQKPAQ